MSIAAASNANQESAREREGLYLSRQSGATPGSDRGRLWPAINVKDFWLFGEVMCRENQTVT